MNCLLYVGTAIADKLVSSVRKNPATRVRVCGCHCQAIVSGLGVAGAALVVIYLPFAACAITNSFSESWSDFKMLWSDF